ncbi:MAG: AbrB/MazE/SpoVT family DNA-binding domain-containing protein [Candidatus Aenigmarchaeota archaeon]|nr:AbrB/MazE/SpoVT family DNA-binding domain-containing protein [Candidatus Aenigmarchaeota archaeon]
MISLDIDSISAQNSVVKIDEKGRISLPADLRRSLGLDKGDMLILNFSLFKREIVLRRGDKNE